ncbi:uncharacterized protein BT62DRAFT_58039 [Guyanagaster necrorhizus]|uniref:Uncharacterized protein n=1 Tax=Guyanagaster necrorhizus TaxID=856835 RepID=A0A9P7W645_9AGAR|nr:uncharacterized protein BT62DRAFT_58039 [Guyanagaster necrorhizus MCA 3950]KAG7453287.1 hypothetical protein BT62DRAFT_58039 [Guyanagaster necrorhizus MCA 3950]
MRWPCSILVAANHIEKRASFYVNRRLLILCRTTCESVVSIIQLSNALLVVPILDRCSHPKRKPRTRTVLDITDFSPNVVALPERTLRVPDIAAGSAQSPFVNVGVLGRGGRGGEVDFRNLDPWARDLEYTVLVHDKSPGARTANNLPRAGTLSGFLIK